MIPYGFGFEPNDYVLDLQDYKKLGRDCKALFKKIVRRVQKKQK